MENQQKIYAIVPARSGSKRIPGKNLKPFLGIPLILRVLNELKRLEWLTKVMVSTDDLKIIELARDIGIEVPFVRPAELSDDFTPTIPVIAHAIKNSSLEILDSDLVICVYATSVLLNSEDIYNAVRMFKDSDGQSVVLALTKYTHPIQRSFRKTAKGLYAPSDENAIRSRTQDLEEHWHDAGQFYLASAKIWKSGAFPRPFIGYEISNSRIIDIDGPDDWKIAEMIFKISQTSNIQGV